MSDIELEIDDKSENVAPARRLSARRIASIGIKTALGMVAIFATVVFATVAIEIYLAGGRLSEVAQNLNSGTAQRKQAAHNTSTGQSWLGRIAAYADVAAHALDSAAAHAQQLPELLGAAKEAAKDRPGASAPGEPSPIHQAAVEALLREPASDAATAPTGDQAATGLPEVPQAPQVPAAGADMTAHADTSARDDEIAGALFGGTVAVHSPPVAATELALVVPGMDAPKSSSENAPSALDRPIDPPAADAATPAPVAEAAAAQPGALIAAIQPEWAVTDSAENKRPEPVPARVVAGWRVQLAALRSRDAAEAAAMRYQTRYRAALADTPFSIARADLAKGTFFRIQVGPLADRAAAAALCRTLKAQQQDCFVVAP